MKKTSLLAAVIIGALQTSCGILGAGFNPYGQTDLSQPQSGTMQPNGVQQQDPLQILLASLANNAVAQSSQYSGQNSSLLGNLIASLTGNYTTTQANIMGTWTYTEPAVQFESQNLLTQAGGTTAATKIESWLTGIYQQVGITSGHMSFTFSQNNQLTCTIGGRSMAGTYVFDNAAKTVTITNSTTGHSLKAYVTISGNNMSLCFDTTRLLSIFSNSQLSNVSTTMSTLSALSQNFNGMKTGFKFTK